MFDKLQTYLLHGNQFCGIELVTKNGQEMFIASILKKTKNQVDFQESFEASSIEGLIEKLPKNLGAFLVLNTDKILTKLIDNDALEPIRLVNKAFPNIDIKDFYYEILVQDSEHFISICRKDYVENILDTFKKANVSIINLSVGSLIISSVVEYLNRDSILTYNHEILCSGKTIKVIKSNTKEEQFIYGINGINASNHNIISLTGALSLVVGRYALIGNIEAVKVTLMTNFKQPRFFGQFLKVGLILIFCLLLVNFLVFNHYFDKVQLLEEASQLNQNTKLEVLELNKKVEKSQKMVEDILKSNASKSSFYVNKIIQELPETIVLSQLDYQPLMKRIKVDQPILNENNVILVSGASTNREFFSEWLVTLEENSWVKKAEISDYTDVSNSSSEFEVKIILIDE